MASQTNKLTKGKCCQLVIRDSWSVNYYNDRDVPVLDAHFEFAFFSALYKNFSFVTKYTGPVFCLYVHNHQRNVLTFYQLLCRLHKHYLTTMK